MNFKSPLRRSSNPVFAVFLSCALLFYLLSIIIPRQSIEDSSICSDGFEYLLGEYKELALQKQTLQKQKYLEAKELKSNLKTKTVDLKLKEKKCSSDIENLNKTVDMWKQKTADIQRLLDGAFSTMDRSSVVLTAVLQALQKAELKVEELEKQLANGGGNGATSTSG